MGRSGRDSEGRENGAQSLIPIQKAIQRVVYRLQMVMSVYAHEGCVLSESMAPTSAVSIRDRAAQDRSRLRNEHLMQAATRRTCSGIGCRAAGLQKLTTPCNSSSSLFLPAGSGSCSSVGTLFSLSPLCHRSSITAYQGREAGQRRLSCLRYVSTEPAALFSRSCSIV